LLKLLKGLIPSFGGLIFMAEENLKIADLEERIHHLVDRL